MMKKMKIAVTLMLLAAFLIPVFGMALAQEKKPVAKADDKKRDDFNNRLQLNEEQKAKMKEIHDKFGEYLEDIKFALGKKRFELADELRKDDPDRKKIDALVQDISTLETKRQKLFIDEFFEIRAALNAEQKKFYIRRFIRQMMRVREK